MRLHALRSTYTRSGKAARARSTGRRRCLFLEPLESRTLPTVSFVPGAYELPQIGAENKPGLVSDVSPVEPLVAINPTDPANVVISSQEGLQVSTNAGRTFSTTTKFPLASGASFDDGDTAMAFDAQGRLFWANLQAFSAGGDDIVVTEINPTTGAVSAGPFLVDQLSQSFTDDKDFLTADVNGNLYVAWTRFDTADGGTQVLLARSTDHGQSWSPPVGVSPSPATSNQGFVWPATVTTAADGDVFVAYHSQPGFIDGVAPDGSSGQTFVVRYSNDLSGEFSNTAAFGPGASDVTFNVQTVKDANGNVTPAPRTIPGSIFWTQGSAQPWVLTDPARPGNVYVVAADDPNNGSGGDVSDVVFARSTDSGATWTTSTIEAGTPLGNSGVNSYQLFPTATIDQSGDLAVAWLDNRDLNVNSSGHYLWDVYSKYSTDGGLTWSNAFQVNSTHFDPEPSPTLTADPATTRIGEYFGLAMSNGLAYVDWNGNTFDPHGAPSGQQVYLTNFQINGSIMLTQPADILTHNLKIDLLPGGPSNFLEILDTTSGTPLTTQRVYVGMGDYLRGISIRDDSNASNIYDIEKTFFGDNVDIHFAGQGGQVVISGVAEDLDNIAGNVNIFSGFGFGSNLVVLDANDPFAGDTWTITRSTIERFGAGTISYDGMDGLGIRGGDLGAHYNVLSTEGATMTSLVGGVSGDVFNVQSTSGPLRIDGTDSTNGLLDTVNVGSLAPALGGTMAGIQGAISIGSSMNKINIDLDDSGDTTGRTVKVTNSAVTGLAPAAIDYTASQVNDLLILGGNGADTFTLVSALASLGISGGGGTNTLVGPNINNTWEITGPGAGTVDGGSFTHMGIVRGGTAADTFQFRPMGSIPVLLDGGAGSNVLDYSTDGGAAVTVNLQTGAASRIKGGAPGGFRGIQRLIGSTATSDGLIGANTATLWQITAANAGKAGAVAFSGFENLRGGTASDTFRFSPSGSLSGSLNGGGGGDWLDYSLFTTSVSVNLATGASSRVGGSAVGKVTQIQNVVGGAGNDTFVGNSQGNILMGGGGNDRITAGSGRSLLIGGAGGDVLKGGPADDLLIAGTTTFDSNHAALMSILAEWQRTDKTYAQRIADLRNGGGRNEANKLVWGTTVHDDGAADTLTGGPGLDWFFANLGPGGVLDHITDRNNGGPEQVD